MLKLIFGALLILLPISASQAAGHNSGLREVEGLKYPSSPAEGRDPVRATALASPAGQPLEGYTELLPFALRSPDQEEAGSCLYMSLTGIAEWWLARLHPELPRTPDGPIDLSERYLMNLAGIDEGSNGVANWKTDSVYLFNRGGEALLNRDYRFTKGWYTRDANGDPQAATASTPGATYDTTYNWIDDLASVGKTAVPVKLPHFERNVLFADPDSNQWDTGVMPDDIADRIKTALRVNKAPVHVIYNHYGYWHATVILGYNDDGDNGQCHFVTRFLSSMTQQAASLRSQAAITTDPTERDALLARAAKDERAQAGAQAAFDRGGGCHPGVFYVRDSIYGDPNGPMYEYDPANREADAPYVKSTVMLEYDWVRTMANHVTQIVVTE